MPSPQSLSEGPEVKRTIYNFYEKDVHVSLTHILLWIPLWVENIIWSMHKKNQWIPPETYFLILMTIN